MDTVKAPDTVEKATKLVAIVATLLTLDTASAVSAQSWPTFTFTSPAPRAYGVFGASAISQGIIAVGGGGSAYTFSAKTGAMIASIADPYPEPGDNFGDSVAISDGIVVIGAGGEPIDGYKFAGTAYVFNATTGALIANLTNSDPQSGSYYGESVAIAGSTAVVSGPGHAYVFNAVTGSLIRGLSSPDQQEGSGFGGSVAISGNTMIVSGFVGALPAPRCGCLVNGSGRAYLYDVATGVLMATLESPTPLYPGFFGSADAISGNIAVIGALNLNPVGNKTASRVYTFDAATGTLLATIASPNSLANESFGYAVAISGSTVVVGAPYEKVGATLSAGYAYAFDASTGALLANFTSPNPQVGGDYGCSVGISADTVVVGAIGESVGEDAVAGRAYAYANYLPYAASAPAPANLVLAAAAAAAAAVTAAVVLAYRSHKTRKTAEEPHVPGRDRELT